MSDDKRNKILMGALALLALGAGSYYFVFSEKESGPEVQAQTTSVRKTRAVKEVSKAKKKKRAVKEDAPERVERKVRERTERSSSRKRRGKGRGPKKVTKRKLTPAA